MPRPPLGQQMLNKVPQVTIFFWVIKILAATVGETAADFLNTQLNFGLTNTTYVMSALLALVLVFQALVGTAVLATTQHVGSQTWEWQVKYRSAQTTRTQSGASKFAQRQHLWATIVW